MRTCPQGRLSIRLFLQFILYVKDPNKAAAFGTYNYLFDVAAHTKGVAYKKFVHIDGWSEHVINYIYGYEMMAKMNG